MRHVSMDVYVDGTDSFVAVGTVFLPLSGFGGTGWRGMV